jgi:c-di-GMP-binding flagellar brake protein YcgR
MQGRNRLLTPVAAIAMGTRQASRLTLRRCPQVSVQLSTAAGEVLLRADVLDMSRGGMKLALSQYVPIGVSLTICFPQSDVRVTATVCWSRKETEQRWWLACVFNPALPDELIQKLLDAGYLERRKHEREPIALAATAKWQTGETAPISIRDFSVGGLCLSSERGAERGQRLLLRLATSDDAQESVLTEVQWQIRFNDSYLIGCSFVNRQGLVAMRKLVPLATAAKPPRGALSQRLWAPLGRLLSLGTRPGRWLPRAKSQPDVKPRLHPVAQPSNSADFLDKPFRDRIA